MTPRFRDGDFDGGVRARVDAVLGAIEGTYEAPDAAPSSPPSPFIERLLALFVAAVGALFGGVPAYASLRAAARGGW